MTDKITNHSDLMDIISTSEININFLSSPIHNEFYDNEAFNYHNFFWRFDSYNSFFHLLQQTEDELLELRCVGKTTIEYLTIFLSKHNCKIGMFKDFTTASFKSLTNEKVRIEDLSMEEKTLSLILIQRMVQENGNDMELGREIRKIFNQLKF